MKVMQTAEGGEESRTSTPNISQRGHGNRSGPANQKFYGTLQHLFSYTETPHIAPFWTMGTRARWNREH